jgi:hypothetical protein
VSYKSHERVPEKGIADLVQLWTTLKKIRGDKNSRNRFWQRSMKGIGSMGVRIRR